MKYLLYDRNDSEFCDSFDALQTDNYSVLNASIPAAKCVGCFKCWLRNPGSCVFDDKLKWVGKEFITCDELTIVCKSLYGGFPPNIKRVIDRVIPGVMPFFLKINNELHHSKRYNNHLNIKVIFYNGDEMSDDEKEQSKKLIAAVGTNFHAVNQQVIFVRNSMEALKEVTK